MSNYNIGVDLGTTNTVCYTMNNGKFENIKIQRKETLPSVLLYKDNEIIIGDKAKKRAQLYAPNYIKSSKTFIGDKTKSWNIEDKEFTPKDVATYILSTVNESAKKHFRTDETISAVITVPAYFTSRQRLETREAAIEAGLDVKKIIAEPVAAAISYGFEDNINQKILVVDLGGGTFDVSILHIQNKVYSTLAIKGDSLLGGDNFDEIILEIFLRFIRKEYGIDFSDFSKLNIDEKEYKKIIQTLLEKSEATKKDLTELKEVKVEFPNLFEYRGELKSFSITVNRDEFKEESFNLIQKIKRTIMNAIEDSGLKKEEIDKVILVGGSSNIPFIRELITEELNQNPYSDRDLSKLVAMGAAIVAYDGDDIISEIEINDIVSHSLGTRVRNNDFSIIIPKGTTYPAVITRKYTTVSDYQSSIKVDIYEGESDKVEDNKFYGSFVLNNIQHARANVPKIEITFSIDKNQILYITALDKDTEASESMFINLIK